jgi:hypothetical protein
MACRRLNVSLGLKEASCRSDQGKEMGNGK